jgi:hypothetical protein
LPSKKQKNDSPRRGGVFVFGEMGQKLLGLSL